MPRLSDLYNINNVFDIIVSDFGRDATLRYLSYFSDLEKNTILQYLEASADFFDEYRRVSICVIGNLGYVKEQALEYYYKNRLPFDNKVLVGFDSSFPYEELSNRIAKLVFYQINLAIQLGYSKIRVVIPCNTLSPVGWYMKDLLNNKFESAKIFSFAAEKELVFLKNKLKNIDVLFLTIPEIVLDYIKQKNFHQIYILGTPDTLEIYQKAVLNSYPSIQIIIPSSEDQKVINNAILDSIDGRDEKIKNSRIIIDELIIRPTTKIYPGIKFVEACTDLNFGIGLNSTNLYVEKLVEEIYKE